MPNGKYGVNLAPVTYSSTEAPFLNIWKQGVQWGGNAPARYTGDSHFNLDSNGYPINMQGKVGSPAEGLTFTNIDSAPFFGFTTWRSGRYVILFDQVGTFTNAHLTISAGGLTTIDSSTQGRIVVNIASPSVLGIKISLAGMDGTNYATNIRLVYGDVIGGSDVQASAGAGGSTTPGVDGTGTYEAWLNQGRVVAPDFLNRFGVMGIFRFMDWQLINGNTVQTWSQKVPPTYVWWKPVPIEVLIQFCNECGCDGWFDMPANADDDYVWNYARLVHDGSDAPDDYGKTWAGLNTNLNAWVHYGNEIWNGAIGALQRNMVVAEAKLCIPGWTSDYDAAYQYAIIRGVQVNLIWNTVWNNSSRVKNVMTERGLGGNGGSYPYLTLSDYHGSYQATFNGFIDDGSGGGSPSGVPGTTLTVNTLATGTMFRHQIVREVNGSGVAQGTIIQADNGDGTWEVNISQDTGAAINMESQYYFGTIVSNYQDGYYTTAPYIGNGSIVGGLTGVLEDDIDAVFTQIGTLENGKDLDVAINFGLGNDAANVVTYGAAYNLGLALYEGGQQFYTYDADPTQNGYKNAAYAAAQRDERMGNVYTTYLQAIDAVAPNGNPIVFCHYWTIAAYSDATGGNNGNFGMLERYTDTSSPKYDAFVNFLQVTILGGILGLFIRSS